MNISGSYSLKVHQQLSAWDSSVKNLVLAINGIRIPTHASLARKQRRHIAKHGHPYPIFALQLQRRQLQLRTFILGQELILMSELRVALYQMALRGPVSKLAHPST